MAAIISKICKPGGFGEFEHPVVEASFRLYGWRDTLSDILHLWTPAHIRAGFRKDVSACAFIFGMVLI